VGTSVFGGVFDEEFAAASAAFFDQVEEGQFHLLTSALVSAELQDAPEEVQAWFGRFEPALELIVVREEVLALRNAYLTAGVVTPRWADDALHVALATVHDAELIVSWNFRHMVNIVRIRGYNAVNLLNGYRTIDIRSPREVISDEEEDV
jgi:hypothetical protein